MQIAKWAARIGAAFYVLWGVFLSSSVAPAGAIARPSMVPTQPSTIASIAGPNADAGGRSSKPWPIAASTA